MAEARPYQQCTRTIMDTSDPDITFDDDGVSSHVRTFEALHAEVLASAQSGKRMGELDELVSKIKRAGKNKPYDCIVGVSGGVDSTYLLLQAVRLGLRPLAVHFDSGWNSELAAGNSCCPVSEPSTRVCTCSRSEGSCPRYASTPARGGR